MILNNSFYCSLHTQKFTRLFCLKDFWYKIRFRFSIVKVPLTLFNVFSDFTRSNLNYHYTCFSKQNSILFVKILDLRSHKDLNPIRFDLYTTFLRSIYFAKSSKRKKGLRLKQKRHFLYYNVIDFFPFLYYKKKGIIQQSSLCK